MATSKVETQASARSGFAAPAELAAHLHVHREAIIVAWEQRVLADSRIPEARELSEPALRNHVPELLDRLVEEIERGDAEGALDASPAEVASRDHARERFSQHYSLQSTIREWAHFRRTFLDSLAQSSLHVDPQHLASIHAAIDEAITCAAVAMHHAEEAGLAESEEKTREQMAFQERFMSILGHDLRTPLNAISMGVTFLLKHADLPEGHAGLLRRVASSATRMSHMINDVLDLARTRLGAELPIDRKPEIDLGAVCESVIDEISAAKPQRRVVLEREGELVGSWDPDRLRQALANLTANALDQSPVASPVNVKVRGQNGLVTIVVENGGPALDAETLAHMFDPYARGANPDMVAQGLGLGMFLVQQIVKSHGGDIDVRSAEGQGTRIEVRLPRSTAAPKCPS